ncbi:MAG TPA: uroporphyrinogen-III synthase, partial [Gaiellaceae bacterium]|nr:uroporphyrinogen-III synthase [Gaiellaceae bacterium]
APHQAGPTVRELEALGAAVHVVPLIHVDPIEDVEPLETCVHGVHRYDWLVVTSANGVAALAGWAAFPWLVRDVRVAAVGPATAAALRQLGVEPAFVPDRYAAAGIASGLAPVDGTRVLLVQADIADRRLAEDLRRRGATVDQIHVYRTVEVEAEEAALAELRGSDAVLLASGSAARSLAAQGGAGDALVVCIGPKTADVAREVGLEVALVADEATAQGMIQALVTHYSDHGESE